MSRKEEKTKHTTKKRGKTKRNEPPRDSQELNPEMYQREQKRKESP